MIAKITLVRTKCTKIPPPISMFLMEKIPQSGAIKLNQTSYQIKIIVRYLPRNITPSFIVIETPKIMSAKLNGSAIS
jgi:hypothetical protein